MKKSFSYSMVFVLSLAGFCFAQENYVNWRYYRFLTVNTTSSGANVAATQTNFPLLVRLSSSNFTFAHAKGNGADIRFTDVAGTTRYKHQIESWDSAGKLATVWVLIPSITGNGSTSFRIYSGNKSCTPVADSSNGPEVFAPSQNFVGVWHMNDTSTNVSDATGNGNTGLNTGTTTTAGTIGLGRNFDGSSYLAIANSAGNQALDVNIENSYTVSAWFNANNWNGNARILQRGGTAPKYGLYDTLSSLFWYTNPTGLNTNPKISDSALTGVWHWVSSTYDDTNAKIYLDGVLRGSSTGSGTLTNSTLAMIIGGKPTSASGSGSTNLFNGVLDEVRLQSAVRDSNWIKLEYQTQKPGSNVVGLGTEQVEPDEPDIIDYVTGILNLIAGAAMTPDLATLQGSCTTTGNFSVSPALPAGLTLNPNTGTISGTPTANVAVATTGYTVTVNGAGGSTSTLGLTITVLTPPVITSQPAATSAALIPGGVAKFGIKAMGSVTLTYKWVRTRGTATDTLANGGTVPAAIFLGAMTDTLTITNPPFSDSNTTYKCVVRNSVGIVVSNAGVLLVRPTSIWNRQIIRVNGANPFSFHIPSNGASNVRMTVEDMSGRAVWSKDFKLDPSREVSWNGNGFDGRPVSPGMYVVKIK